MPIKTSAIQGSEQSGTEEAEIRAAEATARFARTATAIGGAAVRAGVGKVRKTLRERQERLATEPELQGNLYKDYREAFVSHGVPEDVAAEAAADLVQNKEAVSSAAIEEANRIVSQGVSHQPTANEQSQLSECKESDLRQHLMGAELSSEEIQIIDEQRNNEIEAAEAAAYRGELEPGSFLSHGEDSFENRLDRTTLSSEIKAKLNDEFKVELTKVTERGQKDLFTQMTAENSPTPWEMEGYETYADYYKWEVEPELEAQQWQDPPDLEEAYEEHLAAGNALDQKESAQDEVVPNQSLQKKVQFEEPPSEMKWPTLQKTAKAIADETGEKPASGKKADVEPFVTDYWQAQQAEKAVAAKPVVRTPVQSPAPKLAKDYSAGLAAAGADNEIATKAGTALLDGKDASSSIEIAKANSQVSEFPARSRLQQMYYDVLEKQKAISPELTELASKDLAEGKGAHSSNHIRTAHDKILNRELARSGLDTNRQNWSKYSRHVVEPNPNKRDRLIGSAAMKDGVSAKDAKAMIRWSSPVAAQVNQQQSSTAMANYADSIVSQVKAHSVTKQMATGKAVAPVKKGKGVEI